MLLLHPVPGAEGEVQRLLLSRAPPISWVTHVQGIRDLQLAPPVPKASASKQCLRSTPKVIYVPASEGFWEGSRQEHEPSASPLP